MIGILPSLPDHKCVVGSGPHPPGVNHLKKEKEDE